MILFCSWEGMGSYHPLDRVEEIERKLTRRQIDVLLSFPLEQVDYCIHVNSVCYHILLQI